MAETAGGKRKLRVAVDARLISGEWGGVEGVVIGLAEGLSGLTDGDDEFLFLAYEDSADWLVPHLSGPARPLFIRQTLAASSRSYRRRLKRIAPRLAQAWGAHPAVLGPRPRQETSDGTIEKAGVDVVHFTLQPGFMTAVPSIYPPHDLQHVHLPQFFTPAQRRWREAVYGTLCRQASMVAVASSWVKRDVEEHFRVPPGKVVVVPLAPPIAATAPPSPAAEEAIARRFDLPDAYLLYPAQTWPHKNHLRLLDALADLRDGGLLVTLLCTGQQNGFFPTIQRRVDELGLGNQVRWLGFVSESELLAVYRRARAVVVPTLFEAASGPLWEAFREGVPAACSNVTSLPEQAGDAAIVFDPLDVDQMARAIRELWLDQELRANLIARGQARVREFTWSQTARRFRAHYRRIAGRLLSPEDVQLIETPPGI